jgi:hypothetical protein
MPSFPDRPSWVSSVRQRSTKPLSVNSSAIAFTVLRSRASHGGQETDDRREQCGGVQGVRLVTLRQHAPVADTVGDDVRADLRSGTAPFRGQLPIPPVSRQPCGAVERHPAHQFGRHTVLRLTARFPNLLVGFVPGPRCALGVRYHDPPQPPRQPLTSAGVQQNRVRYGTEHVIPPLAVCRVVDPHRCGSHNPRDPPGTTPTALSGGRERAAAGTGADHDDVAVLIVTTEAP